MTVTRFKSPIFLSNTIIRNCQKSWGIGHPNPEFWLHPRHPQWLRAYLQSHTPIVATTVERHTVAPSAEAPSADCYN